jgi:ABC-type Fe3+ transport system permease subunit
MTSAALLSVLSMGVLIAVQVMQDVQTLMTQSLRERITQHALTSLELALLWSTFAALLYLFSKWMSRRAHQRGSES